MQTVAAHWLQLAPSAVPITQTSWSQVVVPPQEPALHVLLQQSLGWLQGDPSSEQACPQTPPLHDPLQQSEPLMHPAPMGWHGPAQTPLLQMPVQQSPGVEHRLPVDKQPPHTEAVQPLLQQSAGLLQPNPLGRHISLHTPPTQFPEQHSGAVSHDEPVWTHSLMHFPPAQLSEQHCGPWVQVSPAPRQLERQTPFGPQTPLQQSLPCLHAALSAPHEPSHFPALHALLQHSAGWVQVLPAGLHWPVFPQVPFSHRLLQHLSAAEHGRPSSWQEPVPPLPLSEPGSSVRAPHATPSEPRPKTSATSASTK